MKSNHLLQGVLYIFMLFPDGSSAGRLKTLNPQNSTFCFWTGFTSDGETHYVFLQKTQTSLLLYDSIWNKNNSLFSCITSNQPSAIKSYVSRCWDLRSSSFSESPDVRFNIRQLVKPDGPCQTAHNLKGISESVRKARELRSVDPDGSVQQDYGESSDLKLRRSKRALMIPGTVWCGSGNKASNFSELGMYKGCHRILNMSYNTILAEIS